MLNRRYLMLASTLALVAASNRALAVQPTETPPISGRLAPVRDTHLWVEDYGPRDAPVLLYVHGGPGLGVFEFSHYMRGPLSRRLRLILVDQRGVLRSDALGEPEHFGFNDLIDDYEALRVVLGIERWTILGHSFGGPVALSYALAHPRSVERVIFENPAMDGASSGANVLVHAADALDADHRPVEAQRLRRLAETRDTRRIWDGMDAALNSLPSRQSLYVHDKSFLGYYGRITENSGISDERWAQGIVMAKILLAEGPLLSPAWNRISALEQPTLLALGVTDPATSPEEIAALRAKPNVTVQVFANSGHFIHVEEPGPFATAIENFILI